MEVVLKVFARKGRLGIHILQWDCNQKGSLLYLTALFWDRYFEQLSHMKWQCCSGNQLVLTTTCQGVAKASDACTVVLRGTLSIAEALVQFTTFFVVRFSCCSSMTSRSLGTTPSLVQQTQLLQQGSWCKTSCCAAHNLFAIAVSKDVSFNISNIFPSPGLLPVQR